VGERYDLAPIGPGLKAMTGVLLLLPPILFLNALLAPAPARFVLGGAFVFVCLIYASVWFWWRPGYFELDGDRLRIAWPARSRTISRGSIRSARIATSKEFRSEYGYGMRIGAGGLWGGFGLLKTRRATFSMWISRLDRMVIVELDGARPLLITPANPERFVESIAAKRSAGGSPGGSQV